MKTIKLGEEFMFKQVDSLDKKAKIIWTRKHGLQLSFYNEKLDFWSKEE